MSTNVKPLEQLEFRGVYTAGNPVGRPRNTAEVCKDFRVMPGNFLRLRSGRSPQYKLTNGTVLNIQPFRTQDFWGSNNQLAQVAFGTGPAWHWFSLLNYVMAPVGLPGVTEIEQIATAYDGGFATTNAAAACNLNDRPVFYNGLGLRNGATSRPALSTYISGFGTRYFGLDAYTPGAAPTVVYTPGAGVNKCLTGLSFYVGLWHRPTDHYSNGVYVGSIGPQAGPGTINLINLNRLSYATHGAGETAELFYVVYATIDGGQVAYLVLNSTLDGPAYTTVASTAISLSIDPTADTGFNLDLTKEVPTQNFPPRPMRSISYVNGRLYGALNTGGQGDQGGRDFTYIPTARDMAAVCWSAAAGDAVDADFLGDPLQSWPLLNLSYTPSCDQPLVLAPAEDAEGSQHLLVITATSTFYLEEQADGLHEWFSISRVHGIGKPQTLRLTPYGMVWVDQRNQIVLLAPGSLQVQVLSGTYQNLLSGNVRCADYVLDPQTQTDRYQVWFDNATSVCHDFLLDGPGVAYTATNQDFTAAASAVDSYGRSHHILAKDALYTHEYQPSTGGVLARDGTFNPDGSISWTEINGVYARNWDDFGDGDVRKELPMLDIIGDGDPTAALTGTVSPLTVEWYGDFVQVIDANRSVVTGTKLAQSATNPTYRFKLTAANKFWYKIVVKLAGHSADLGGLFNFPDLATEGNLAKNFFGCVLRLLWRLGTSENRA
jgi:hypothetical protein